MFSISQDIIGVLHARLSNEQLDFRLRSIAILFDNYRAQYIIFIGVGFRFCIQLYFAQNDEHTIPIHDLLHYLFRRECDLCCCIQFVCIDRREKRRLFPAVVCVIDFAIHFRNWFYAIVLFAIPSECGEPQKTTRARSK